MAALIVVTVNGWFFLLFWLSWSKFVCCVNSSVLKCNLNWQLINEISCESLIFDNSESYKNNDILWCVVDSICDLQLSQSVLWVSRRWRCHYVGNLRQTNWVSYIYIKLLYLIAENQSIHPYIHIYNHLKYAQSQVVLS